ncbi:MAG: MFS transporter [Candidatus Lokiarchaeota archaeon]|nr:MFS transporter [Candidatus Lokiarchaeota archaeon]
MKRLRYKTELEEDLGKSSGIKLENDFLIIQTPKKLKSNYIGFFFVYFTLSSITAYLTVYLPVYLLSILNVNRSELAFIQIYSYSVLFLAPFLGFFFDKYTYRKNLIIVLSIILFLFSSLTILLSGMIIHIFGIFLALNLLSHETIKVGMGRILIESSLNEVTKDKSLIIINISSNIGGFIPSLIFLFVVTDVFDLNLWTNFLFFGGISLIPILFAIFCFDYKQTAHREIENLNVKENDKRSYPYQILFLTLSFIMIWSDRLYLYPFSSWILSKFGEIGLRILSSSYIIFLILNTFGYVIGRQISKKLRRKNIILITNCVYICLILLMAYSNLFYLLIIYALIWFVSGIMLLNYTSLIISFSKRVKYQNFSYQMLRFAVAIASVIFIPIGTFLSSFISTEFLILMAGFLSFFSLVPLFFIKST